MRAVLSTAMRRRSPQRLHVRLVDPLRQAAIGCDLRTLHPAQRADLPQTLAYQVIAKAAHRAQHPVHRRLRTEAGTCLHVTCDRVRINAFNRDSRPSLLQPSPPAIQTRLRVRNRRPRVAIERIDADTITRYMETGDRVCIDP